MESDDVLGSYVVDKLKTKVRFGRTPDGGNQGSSKVEEYFSVKPNVYQEGSDSWVIGRPRPKDMLVTGPKALLAINAKQHHIILGNTRSEKGVSQIMWNVLRTQPGQSQVVFDPKGEAYMICAEALKKQGKRVVLLDPFRVINRRLGLHHIEDQCAYNPLFEIDPKGRDGPRQIGELADILIEKPKGGQNGGSEYWNKLTRNVCKALLAFALINKPPKALEIARQAASEGRTQFTPSEMKRIWSTCNLLYAANFAILDAKRRMKLIRMMRGLREQIRSYAKERNLRPIYPPVLRMIEAGAADAEHLLGDRADAEGMRSLLTMFTSSFGWVDTPEMVDDLCGFDFRFRFSQLKKQENLAVFVVVPDTALESHGAYLRMIVTCVINAITGNDWPDGVNPKRHAINVIMDECPLYGHLPALLRGFSLGRGYDMRLIVVAQNKTQLDEVYGANVTAALINNACTVLLGGADVETPEYFSRAFGEMYGFDEEEGEDEDDKVQVYTASEILKMTHASRKYGILYEGGRGPLIFEKRRYFDVLTPGVDFTQIFEHATLADQLLTRNADADLVALPRGFARQKGDSDDLIEHIAFDDQPLLERY